MIKDLKDSNYNYSSPKINAMNMAFHQKRNYSFWWGVMRYLGKFIKSISTLKGIGLLLKIDKDRGYIILNSKNQYLAVEPLLHNSSIKLNAIGVEWANSKTKQYPLFIAYILSVFYIPVVVYYYFTDKDTYFHKSVKYAFNEYCLTNGYRLLNNFWLSYNKPQFVIIVNDHHFAARDFVKSAKKKRIPTIYIQHASVTEAFPKLLTDYAFLEGKDAEDKYFKNGDTNTIVKLVGILKFDGMMNAFHKKNQAYDSIGICTNQFDSFPRVEELITELRQNNQCTYILRPHPGDPEYHVWKKLAEKLKIEFSESKEETATQFFNNADIIISYNCNILLESIIFNKPTFSYRLADESFDHYGFVKNKLVTHYESPKKLKEKLEHLDIEKNWRANAKRYCDTIGTSHEGKSLQLIEKYIHEIFDNQLR